MNRFIFISILSMVASIAFGQLRVSTNGSFGTTSSTPLLFNVNNGTKAGSTGSASITNVSFGYQALNSLTSGTNNTAVGYNALRATTTGSYNTAQGCSALDGNISGVHNVAFGMDALAYNVSGGYNSGYGSGALRTNTGGYNTAVGYYSLSDNTSGTYNTAIGYMAGVSSGALTNTTAIGRQASVTASNQVRIGNSSVGSIGGYVGWSNISDRRIKNNIRANVPGLAFINSLQPVTYNLNLNAIDNLTGAKKAEIFDEREKASREAREQQIQTGFIAQDVEKIAKNIGYEFSGVEVDEIGVYSLRYAEFVVPLVKAVQELSEQNDLLKEQIGELKEEIDFLKVSPRSATSSDQITDMPRAILYQNAPNPFSNQTVIKYELPDNASAYIYVFNMQGTLVKQIPLQSQQQNVTINGSELTAGMYLYSLIVNGKEVDTKRMILTN